MGYWCNKCNDTISFNVYEYSTDKYGKALCMDCQHKKKSNKSQSKSKLKKSTPEAKMLYEALRKRGIKCELEASDGHKSIDISIKWAGLDIEIDGKHHVYNAKQMYADIERAEYSAQDGFHTLRFRNSEIKKGLNKIADNIAEAARKRYYDN